MHEQFNKNDDCSVKGKKRTDFSFTLYNLIGISKNIKDFVSSQKEGVRCVLCRRTPHKTRHVPHYIEMLQDF